MCWLSGSWALRLRTTPARLVFPSVVYHPHVGPVGVVSVLGRGCWPKSARTDSSKSTLPPPRVPIRPCRSPARLSYRNVPGRVRPATLVTSTALAGSPAAARSASAGAAWVGSWSNCVSRVYGFPTAFRRGSSPVAANSAALNAPADENRDQANVCTAWAHLPAFSARDTG